MAVGVPRNNGQITQVSWTDGTAQDTYYGLEHSFQYASNINTDDELHGIKLSQKAEFVEAFENCQLISCGEHGVMALDVTQAAKPKRFDATTFSDGGETEGEEGRPNPNIHVCPGTVFQDYVWYSNTVDGTAAMRRVNVAAHDSGDTYIPYDHNDYTDESIMDEADATLMDSKMMGNVSAILNYNNTRLVVACGQDIWVYYPELDVPGSTKGKTGWKKVLHYEPGVVIVGLTCTFEYLKVWAVDEGWNTKVYYYQGNNNLRSTFVYNIVDLQGVRVTRVYSINGIDYYVTSIDGTDGYVNLYKLVGVTPVLLFKQRAGKHPLDINFKDPYFVGPCGIGSGYYSGTFYIADAYGLFKFQYEPEGFDKGYMKWLLKRDGEDYTGRDPDPIQPYGVCENQGFLYVSTAKGCWKMRAYDTGVDGYQKKGVLISREYEGEYGGTMTKMLDAIRLNYEMNPGTDDNGSIDVYVSPNNLWTNTSVFTKANNWYHVMHLDQTHADTRAEVSYAVNNFVNGMPSSFAFDRQTITYAIVITRNDAEQHATPIVRQIDVAYHTKDKMNKVDNLTKSLIKD